MTVLGTEAKLFSTSIGSVPSVTSDRSNRILDPDFYTTFVISVMNFVTD